LASGFQSEDSSVGQKVAFHREVEFHRWLERTLFPDGVKLPEVSNDALWAKLAKVDDDVEVISAVYQLIDPDVSKYKIDQLPDHMFGGKNQPHLQVLTVSAPCGGRQPTRCLNGFVIVLRNGVKQDCRYVNLVAQCNEEVWKMIEHSSVSIQ